MKEIGANAGKSGAKFYLTHNEEFIVKTVSVGESEQLNKIATKYRKHMKEGSFLTVFVGSFRYYEKKPKELDIRLVVMKNLAAHLVQPYRKYDLKGIKIRKHNTGSQESSEGDPNVTFTEGNFMTARNFISLNYPMLNCRSSPAEVPEELQTNIQVRFAIIDILVYYNLWKVWEHKFKSVVALSTGKDPSQLKMPSELSYLDRRTEQYFKTGLEDSIEDAVLKAQSDARELLKKAFSKDLSEQETSKMDILQIVTHIDLTTLSGDDNREKVEKLVNKAVLVDVSKTWLKCASVCVYPARVLEVANHLNKVCHVLPIASVAGGFPSGQYHLLSRLLEIELAVKDGATEIDVVINRAAALEENWEVIYQEIKMMKARCGPSVLLKVILAVGELQTNERIYKASWIAIFGGADFIKTSTGKETTNATYESAFIMCSVIKMNYEIFGKKVGFKPAGGIKTVEDAMVYRFIVQNVLGMEWINPQFFRIGASSLLEDILKKTK
uniref:deoxyribose-phosphate aldolase n=1 Tax=Ditylenchus dipsaci TaxID=166011 RepID=A0A915DND1_9BILA